MAKFASVWSFGTSLSNCTTVVDALATADLDFVVSKSPLLATDPSRICPKHVGTYRTDTGAILGVVGKDYGVVQNADAFAFADYIPGILWDNGGYTDSGLAFLVGHLSPRVINGETYTPYIVFQNAFNGRWNLKGQVILQDDEGRVLNLPGKADIKIRHSARAEDRVRVAQSAMSAVESYITSFAEEAADLSKVIITNASLEVVVSDILFPVKAGDSERTRNNALARREEFMASYNEETAFNGTAWGVVKAWADFTAKCGAKLAKKGVRRAESVMENTLISGKSYSRLIKKLEALNA